MNQALAQSEKFFHQALALEPKVRSSFLSYLRAEHPGACEEVEKLLAAHESAKGFMEKPAFETGSEFFPAASKNSQSLRKIGQYRILGLISSGGMGIVYRGEQENPRRAVAVKVIRPGFILPETLRRFEQEAQLLGRLHHPGIAQIFEAGNAETETGLQPFFAMEFIHGSSLTDFARRRGLGVRERVKLLIQVCQAVHHAHQMGVIHRDLKPANILVERGGQPKILDFGVARVVGAGRRLTMQTGSGQLIGTVPYMSPEQVSGAGDLADARSDVYALAVIGFELLTGKLPYDLNRKTIPQAARIIEENPPRSLGSLDRGLCGDLETIFSKALEKEKERRYDSARDFATDLERFLSDEPIAARPASAVYQVRKFARRNKGFVAGIFGIILALAAGLAATMIQAERAMRSEAMAKAAQAEAEKIAAREQNLRKQAERDRARLQVAEAFNRNRLTNIRTLQVRQGPGRGKGSVTPAEEKDILRSQEILLDIVNAVEAGAKRDDAENREALKAISTTIKREFSNSPKIAEELVSIVGWANLALGLD